MGESHYEKVNVKYLKDRNTADHLADFLKDAQYV